MRKLGIILLYTIAIMSNLGIIDIDDNTMRMPTRSPFGIDFNT
jgi:hypothetical protein